MVTVHLHILKTPKLNQVVFDHTLLTRTMLLRRQVVSFQGHFGEWTTWLHGKVVDGYGTSSFSPSSSGSSWLYGGFEDDVADLRNSFYSSFIFIPLSYIMRKQAVYIFNQNLTIPTANSHSAKWAPVKKNWCITTRARKNGTARYKEYAQPKSVPYIIKANNDHHGASHCQLPISSFSEDMAYSSGRTWKTLHPARELPRIDM